MDSVGSTEEEVKLNTPVPVPYKLPSFSSSPPFFPQVSNPAAEEANINVSGEVEGTEEARKVVVSEKDGNTVDLSGELIMESVGNPEEEVKLNTPVPTCSRPRRPFFLHALSFECTSKLCIDFLNKLSVYFHI